VEGRARRNVKPIVTLGPSYMHKGFGEITGSKSSWTRFCRRIFLRFPKTSLIGMSDGPPLPKLKCFHGVAFPSSSFLGFLGVVGIL
jgi:hypothetical protein